MAAKQKSQPRPATEAEIKAAHSAAATPATPASLLPAAFGLKLLVFVAGAVLMGLEIVGSRILAPYFGNSVFVWGSLISLFLIALSAGYYIGGAVSDSRPSQSLLNAIVIAVAAFMFLIAVVAAPVCDATLRAGFNEKSGPFLAATVLFLLPSVGMGMVSPFAIRLATHTVASVGKTAGTLYALSTLGSIAGTVLTTFVFIPSSAPRRSSRDWPPRCLSRRWPRFPLPRSAGPSAAPSPPLSSRPRASMASAIRGHPCRLAANWCARSTHPITTLP
jgi:hypothetical protein